MKGVHPFLVASIVFLVLTLTGAYMMKRTEAFFDVASRAASQKCEKDFQDCVKGGGGLGDCTSAYNTCTSKITNPSVSTRSVADASGTNFGESGVFVKTLAYCTQQLTVCKSTGGKTCDADYNTCKSMVAGNTGGISSEYTKLAQQAQSGTGSTDNSYQKFLKQVQSNLDIYGYPDPTASQLALAQGGDIVSSLTGQPDSTYTPSQTVIAPHQTPTPQLTTYTPVPTPGTGAQQIQSSGYLTPSQRQNIRDEVAKIFQDTQRNFNNEYEIQYVHQ